MRRVFAVNFALLAVVALVVSSHLASRRARAQSATDPSALFEAGDYGGAERGFRELMTRRDSAPRARLGLAQVLHAVGRDEEALSEAARAANGSDRALASDAQTLIAEIEFARGRDDAALNALRGAEGIAANFRARLVHAELHVARGRKADAEILLMELIDAYNDGRIGPRDAAGLAYVGRAAQLLGSYQDANDAFRESARASGTRADTQIAWARLFLEKYDTGHAEECLRDALSANPNHADAHALYARVKLEQSFDFAGARAEIERALSVHPNHAEAHWLRAGIAIREMQLNEADQHLNRALSSQPKNLEALTLRAAVRFLADDTRGFERAKRAVFAVNPRFSGFYTIVAQYADWEHRYPEIVAMTREAVALEPDDALAHATLGLNLLRTGDEDEGLRELREAWQRDRFNVQVYNMLNLFDDTIGPHYVTFESGPFVFRTHSEERGILERYVPRVLEPAYRDMIRRYGLTPEGPIRIELYSDPEHFSVRTTGLPRAGVQGVCFGKVVTSLSPRGGPFNWGQILWHELSHVFHIQITGGRVPRWFTEGLAEYETMRARPEWQREDDHLLRRAFEAGRLPPLGEMNRAFTHARSGEDMLLAYYLASQAVAFLVEQYGFDKVPRFLRELRRGRPIDVAFSRGFRVSIEDANEAFLEHLRARYRGANRDYDVDLGAFDELPVHEAAFRANPSDPTLRAAWAASLLRNGRGAEARREAEAVLGGDPSHGLARYVLLMEAVAARDSERIETHARALEESGKDGYRIRIARARGALARGDAAAARVSLEAATRIDARRVEAFVGLRELAAEAHDEERELDALLHIAALEQHDREAAARLIELLIARRRYADVATWGEKFLLLDPERAALHLALGDALLALGRHSDALFEYDSGLLCSPEDAAVFHAGRARALSSLRRNADARRAAEEAVRLRPNFAGELAPILGARSER